MLLFKSKRCMQHQRPDTYRVFNKCSFRMASFETQCNEKTIKNKEQELKSNRLLRSLDA